jgi:hypothetical protein
MARTKEPLVSCGLKVVDLFDQVMGNDIVGSLRRSADSIEGETIDNDRTIAMIAIQVTESGEVVTYGWGATDRFHALGVLSAAAQEL